MKSVWRSGIAVAATVMLSLTALTSAQAGSLSPTATDNPETTYGLSQVFTYFFMMLGPIKIIPPFVKMTHGVDDAERSKFAINGFLLALAVGVVAALLGQRILVKWGVSFPALLMAAGAVMLFVNLSAVLAQYAPHVTPAAPDPGEKPTTSGKLISPLVFPTIITPYGIAILILLTATLSDPAREISVLGVFAGVMVLNLLAMLFSRQILKLVGTGPLAVIGSILSILIVALSFQLFLTAVRLFVDTHWGSVVRPA